MLAGAVVGVLSGVVVIGFYGLIDLSHLALKAWPERHVSEIPAAIFGVGLTSFGLWLAWYVARRAGVAEGQNVPDVQRAVAKRGGIISSRAVAARTFASAITLGSGASVGGEGPIAVLGAAVGSQLGRRLKFQPRHLKILVGCGAAAGIAGAFNAPFAGAFFALEEILGSFSVGAFSPVVIASVVGALTVEAVLGTRLAFHMPAIADGHHLANALLYPILGIACGLVSALYSRLDGIAPSILRRIPGPEWVRPVVGGAVVGVVGLASGGLLAGNGHLALPDEVFGGLARYVLIALAFAKMLATIISLSAGGSGGVFTPALFIGASLGGGVGTLLADIVPGDVVHPASWALVGMAGLVSGATRAPLTAIFMVFELTNDSSYVAPLMIVSVVAFVTARRFSTYGLYDGWLARRGEYLTHGYDAAIMDHLNVREAVNHVAPRVAAHLPVAAVASVMGDERVSTLPVLEETGALLGVISSQELHDVLQLPSDRRRELTAKDVVVTVTTLQSTMSLNEALAAMAAVGRDALPVVDADSDGVQRFAGMLTRGAVFSVYDRALQQFE